MARPGRVRPATESAALVRKVSCRDEGGPVLASCREGKKNSMQATARTNSKASKVAYSQTSRHGPRRADANEDSRKLVQDVLRGGIGKSIAACSGAGAIAPGWEELCKGTGMPSSAQLHKSMKEADLAIPSTAREKLGLMRLREGAEVPQVV